MKSIHKMISGRYFPEIIFCKKRQYIHPIHYKTDKERLAYGKSIQKTNNNAVEIHNNVNNFIVFMKKIVCIYVHYFAKLISSKGQGPKIKEENLI